MAAIPREQWSRVKRLYLSGLPVRAVAERMGAPVDAVTYALRSLKVPRRTPAEANRLAFQAKHPSFSIRKKSARSRDLETIGAALYWAEGYKTNRAGGIDFANSDPEMVALFVRFLRDRYALDESRLRCFIYCYADQDIGQLTTFWSRLLDVPRNQFTKPYVRPAADGNARVMPHGMVHVRYSDKKLLLDVLNLVESLAHRYCVGGGVVKRTTL